MLFAERHRKLGRDGSLAHDRAEDLLTSTAIQLLNYLPPETGILAVLERVRAVARDGRVEGSPPSWLNLAGVTRVEYKTWPYWGDYGQPDVVVTLFAESIVRGRLVVEAKLYANKSGGGDNEEEPTDSNNDGVGVNEKEPTDEVNTDQLTKYWQGLRHYHGAEAYGVVYLTSHAVPPQDELADSLSKEEGDWLGWLSWRDVWASMRQLIEGPGCDLAEILALKGLKHFEGFSLCKPVRPPDHTMFWTQPPTPPIRWFEMSPLLSLPDPRFWT